MATPEKQGRRLRRIQIKAQLAGRPLHRRSPRDMPSKVLPSRKSYLGARIAFALSLALTIASLLGILAMQRAIPFASPLPLPTTGPEPYRISLMVFHQCDDHIELRLHASLLPDGNLGIRVWPEAREDGQVFEGFGARDFFEGCRTLDITVMAANEAQFLDLYSDKPPKNGFIGRSLDRNWHVSTLSLADRYAGEEITITVPDATNHATFSRREFQLDVQLVWGDEPGPEEPELSDNSPKIAATLTLANLFDIVRLMPEPKHTDVLNWFSHYRFFAERSMVIRTVFVDLASKKLEDFLTIFLSSLLGVGSAGIYQSLHRWLERGPAAKEEP